MHVGLGKRVEQHVDEGQLPATESHGVPVPLTQLQHRLPFGQTRAWHEPHGAVGKLDHVLARGEVGKVGVPIAHLGHMRTLLDGIPPRDMNTSMTINAPAAWLLSLYVAHASEHGVDSRELRGTTQNDVLKEYLSRGTFIFPPAPSRRLTVDTIIWCAQHAPKWNPMNVC
ncbi:MAG: hypothetical protein EBS32_13275, partial [Actinobacteria bacterium]|nr:hypothetical protein [Actinomycetota bacterium]